MKSIQMVNSLTKDKICTFMLMVGRMWGMSLIST